MPSFDPTSEQLRAVELYKSGGDLGVKALAGSGKTSTCILMAEAVPCPTVYLCFNKSIAEEAATKFPGHVKCSTQHSFAYRAVGAAFNWNSQKLTGRLYSKDVVQLLGIKSIGVFNGTVTVSPFTIAYCVLETIQRFCQSDEPAIHPRHFFHVPAMTQYERVDYDVIRHKTLEYAGRLWAAMVDPVSTAPLGFSGYLKYWALNDPIINTTKIIVDEAQDTNPVMLGVLRQQQHAELCFVGDPHQQIYEWRGAIDAMEKMRLTSIARLSKSFRFGQNIADFASGVLRKLGDDIGVIGNEHTTPGLVSIPRESPVANVRPVFLCRTNASILDAVVEAAVNASGLTERICVNGGVRELSSLVNAAKDVHEGRVSAHPLFMGFKDWAEFCDYAGKTGDVEAATVVKIQARYGLNAAANALSRVTDQESGAAIIFSTAHKAKGREWPFVQLWPDYQEQPGLDKDTEVLVYNNSELRLIYVAGTRAQEVLEVPNWMIEQFYRKRNKA